MDRQEYLTRMALYFKARERSEVMSKTAFDWGDVGTKAMGWIKNNYDKAGPALLLALLGGWAGHKAAGPAGGMLGALLGGAGGWYGRRAFNAFGSLLENPGNKPTGQQGVGVSSVKAPEPTAAAQAAAPAPKVTAKTPAVNAAKPIQVPTTPPGFNGR